jgi:hypothetical protein
VEPARPGAAFVLRAAEPRNSARWVVGPPRDPYGDGYVLRVVNELHDDGLSAVAESQIDGAVEDRSVIRLPAFVQTLADGWRGWAGVRSWRSLDRGLTVYARHDGRSYVVLEVILRRFGPTVDDTRWTAKAVFQLEAGEELAGIAANLAEALALGA